MQLNNYDYVHIGNDCIKEELFIQILNNEIKPSGGFWSSPFNNITGSLSDWSDYILEEYERFLHFSHTKGCLFNIKKDAKICKITRNKEFDEVKKIYMRNGQIDYEAISNDYDCLIVNPYSLSYELRNTFFYNWSVRTLLIFNMKIIEEYLPFEFEFRKNEGFYITNIHSEKKVQPLSPEFYQNRWIVFNLFQELQKKKGNLSIDELDTIKSDLLLYSKSCVPSTKWDMLEAIIIDESTKQKKLINKKSV